MYADDPKRNLQELQLFHHPFSPYFKKLRSFDLIDGSIFRIGLPAG
jgi:hypothetical protein